MLGSSRRYENTDLWILMRLQKTGCNERRPGSACSPSTAAAGPERMGVSEQPALRHSARILLLKRRDKTYIFRGAEGVRSSTSHTSRGSPPSPSSCCALYTPSIGRFSRTSTHGARVAATMRQLRQRGCPGAPAGVVQQPGRPQGAVRAGSRTREQTDHLVHLR